MDLRRKSTILITCSYGLTEYVRREAEAMGYAVVGCHKAGVEVEGNLIDAIRLNLYLRTAYNVLYLLDQFSCRTPDELYEQVGRLAWEQIISPEEYVSVTGRIDTGSIDNSMYANLKVKDAIVDRIMAKTGGRPNSGKDKGHVVVQVYWKDDRCWVYLNTSGQKISDRGYRRMPHTAPLRESLAAAILMETGYDGGGSLICPMCGSGTLAIEGALMAGRRAPGLLRTNYAFMHLKPYDESVWRGMRAEAMKQSKKRGGKAIFTPGRIVATDIDPKAVEAARKNATTAGVDHLIDFDVCDFADTAVEPGGGIVVMNPEYGARLGEVNELKHTYRRIGDFFKQTCAGYTGYIFTGNMQLAKQVGLRTRRRIPFYNADMECRLLEYELYSG